MIDDYALFTKNLVKNIRDKPKWDKPEKQINGKAKSLSVNANLFFVNRLDFVFLEKLQQIANISHSSYLKQDPLSGCFI
jgi:hypothetical protein